MSGKSCLAVNGAVRFQQIHSGNLFAWRCCCFQPPKQTWHQDASRHPSNQSRAACPFIWQTTWNSDPAVEVGISIDLPLDYQREHFHYTGHGIETLKQGPAVLTSSEALTGALLHHQLQAVEAWWASFTRRPDPNICWSMEAPASTQCPPKTAATLSLFRLSPGLLEHRSWKVIKYTCAEWSGVPCDHSNTKSYNDFRLPPWAAGPLSRCLLRRKRVTTRNKSCLFWSKKLEGDRKTEEEICQSCEHNSAIWFFF